MSTGAGTALEIDRIRAAFPALEREIAGKPVAYLDSGASSQRALASIEAVSRYERRHHSNVHRGSHTLSAEATAAYEGARATVADHLGATDRRELIFTRNATESINLVARSWGAANIGSGDRIVLSVMEHHSNIVPWQQLAEASGAEIDWVDIDDDGPPGYGWTGPGAGPRTQARRDQPRLERARHRKPNRRDRPPRPRRRGTYLRRWRPGCAEAGDRRRRTRRRLLCDNRPQDLRPNRHRGALGPPRPAARDAAIPRRWLDDPQGDQGPARPTPSRRPASKPARRQSPRRSAWPPHCAGSTASAWTLPQPTIARSPTTHSGVLGEIKGIKIYGPPRGDGRLGPVSFELDGVHGHDIAEILDRHGVAVRAGHHCAQPLMERLGVAATARASFGIYTTTGRDRPPGRRSPGRPKRFRV